MEKLLAAFKASPTDANRARLQKHIIKYPMCLCFATAEMIAFFRANGFKV